MRVCVCVSEREREQWAVFKFGSEASHSMPPLSCFAGQMVDYLGQFGEKLNKSNGQALLFERKGE